MLIPDLLMMPMNGRILVKKLLITGVFLLPPIALAAGGLSTSAEFDVGYGYDSNVSVDDVDLSTNIGDQLYDLRVAGDLKYEVNDELSFSGGLTLTDKRYDTFDQYDGRLTLATIAATKKSGALEWGLTARFIDYQLDGDGLLELKQVSPTLSWFPSKKTFVRVSYELSDESYDANRGRDNDRDELGFSFYYFVSGLRHYVTLQAEVAREVATTDQFSKDVRQLRLAWYRRLDVFGRNARFKLGYRYQERDYDEGVNVSIGDFRADTRHRYEVELDVPLNKHWSVRSEVVYNDYESNFQSADYTQQMYQITVKYKF